MDLSCISTKDLMTELLSRHGMHTVVAPTKKHLAHITFDELSSPFFISRNTFKGPCTVLVLDIDINKLNIKEIDRNE